MSLTYICPKCQHTVFETGELRATGSFLGKIFNVQTRKFTSVTCARCRYTELFDAPSSKLGHVFDFFMD